MMLFRNYPELTKRQNRIFETLLELFISEAKPVGSSQMAVKSGIGLSPASIRKVMAELEDLGLVKRSHASSGRIPTDFGYGYYVDVLMRKIELSHWDKRAISSTLEDAGHGGLGEILKRTSVVLSRVSMLISIVIPPPLVEQVLLKIDLVRVSSTKLMIVLSIRDGEVKSLMMDLDQETRDHEIETVSILINERLAGLTLGEVKKTIRERLSYTPGLNEKLIENLIDVSNKLFTSAEEEKLYLGENHHVMFQPEFSDSGRVREVFEVLENQQAIVNLLQSGNHATSEGIRIGIGRELNRENLDYCSFIATDYLIDNLSGKLGIIGPKRMNYARLSSLVNYTADIIQQNFGK